MPDMSAINTLVSSLNGATTILKGLWALDRAFATAEAKGQLADSIKLLSEATVAMASLQEENAGLKRRIRELEGVDGERCPSCRRMGWRVVDSKPDPAFGVLGVASRTYRCSECGFSEAKKIG